VRIVLTVPDAKPPVPSASSHSALFSAITDSPAAFDAPS
jgi:hypothetical protein